MLFIEPYTESEKQNGCMGTEWWYIYWVFTLEWLTGSCGCP